MKKYSKVVWIMLHVVLSASDVIVCNVINNLVGLDANKFYDPIVWNPLLHIVFVGFFPIIVFMIFDKIRSNGIYLMVYDLLIMYLTLFWFFFKVSNTLY